MEIEYDPRKAASNLKKHKISFEEAAESLHDPLARVIPDPDCEGGRTLCSDWDEP